MKKAVYIIAEAGVNHNGDIELAKKLVRVAAACQADAIKFQTFNSEALVSSEARKAAYQEKNTGEDGGQLEMLKSLELSVEQHRILADLAALLGIDFISTPFDEKSADMLEEFDMSLNKIPSGELTNAPLLAHIASKKIPTVLSTGMAETDEIQAALEILLSNGLEKEQITLLKCTTDYPTPFRDANIRGMITLRDKFGVQVGYSDHTAGFEVPIAAVALGASIIEKHITLDRSLPGPDHAASIEPHELSVMVRCIRNVELALGSGEIAPSPAELKNRTAARKSIHLASDVSAGVPLKEEDLTMKRPGDGISPLQLDEVIGKKVRTPLSKDHKLTWEDLE